MRHILVISDHHRHELGGAASLALQGYDVKFMYIDSDPHFINIFRSSRTVQVEVDHKYFVDVPVIIYPMTRYKPSSSFVLKSNLIKDDIVETLVKNEQFDLIVTTQGVPFILGRALSKLMKTPMITRIWGLLMFKLAEHFYYANDYLATLRIYREIVEIINYITKSASLVVLEDISGSFLMRLRHNVYVIYPTYASIHKTDCKVYADIINYKLKEIIESKKPYIFSIILPWRLGPGRWLDYQLFKILYVIAKRIPDTNIVVAGGTNEDIRIYYGISKIPENLIFVGYAQDPILRILYENATLIVVPIFFKSISNRLLEALYYGKPILSNTNAIYVHKKLRHLHHLYVSDNYQEYPTIIRNLLRNDWMLEELSRGAKKAYTTFFSARKHGLFMRYIINYILD